MRVESVQYGLTPYCTLRSLAVAGRTAGSGILLQGLLEACEIAGPRIVPVVAMVRRVRPERHIVHEPELNSLQRPLGAEMESVQYVLTPYCTLRSLAVAGRTAGSGILLQGLLEACEIAGPRIVPVVAMVRRVRPVLDVGDEPVLDWIEPSVVDVVRVVPI